jgi:DNA-binding Xre family transcriptional regulator
MHILSIAMRHPIETINSTLRHRWRYDRSMNLTDIRARLQDRSINLSQLARRAGIGRRTADRVRNGTASVTLATLEKLARALRGRHSATA